MSENILEIVVTSMNTGWSVNCEMCDKAIDNSTEIELRNKNLVSDPYAHFRTCHYCSNVELIPLLKRGLDGYSNKPSLAKKQIINCIKTILTRSGKL